MSVFYSTNLTLYKTSSIKGLALNEKNGYRELVRPSTTCIRNVDT